MDPAFTRLLHQLAPPSALLSFLPKESFPSADFQSSIHTVISTALSRPHPPPRSHIKRVLKALIENLESLRTQYGTEDDEIDEGLMSLYTELLVEPPEAIRGLNSATQKVPVGYTIPGPALRQKDSEIMTIYESPNVISGAGTTGFRTWEAALALCELLILSDRPRRSSTPMAFPPVHVGGQSVLELGAGTGAVSILAAKLGARKVLCTDGDSGMVNLAAGNVRVNKVGGVVECVQLLWGEEVGDGDGTDIRARLGLVLAADVVCRVAVGLEFIAHKVMCRRMIRKLSLLSLKKFPPCYQRIQMQRQLLRQHCATSAHLVYLTTVSQKKDSKLGR